jgi:hypothetical protein
MKLIAQNYVQQEVKTLSSWIYFMCHFKAYSDDNHYTVE